MQAIDLEIAHRAEIARLKRSIVRLKWHAAATRFEIALRRHDRALKYAYKYGYNPGQPRDDHGRWTDTGGGQARIRLAGDIPTGDSPEIPKERPPTSWERTAYLKIAARLLGVGATVAELAKVSAWLRTHSAEIESYRDPPKSLEELQQAVSTKTPGYQNHHIVEQSQAEDEGFSRDIIDSPENLVRIPKMKHEDINGWFQRENREYPPTPREYLSGRNWEVRRAVGLDALRRFGVLKP